MLFPPSLHRCCCEPTVQIESYESLKLVRNLRGIVVLAIRVIDCLDALSGCIISLWLRLGLGSDPGAKWLKSKRNQAWGEWAEPVIYDKIQHFHYTWMSRGESRENILYKYVQKVEGLRGKWFRMMKWGWFTWQSGTSLNTNRSHAQASTSRQHRHRWTHTPCRTFQIIKLKATPQQHPCCE